jgi:hypothetical protein
MSYKKTPNHGPFYVPLIGIILLYFILEWLSIHQKALCNDDFWLTYHNIEYLKGIPYRDFPPYKSVLGYYAFLPGLLWSPHLHGITPFIHMKLWITCLNIMGLLSISVWMRKFYPPKAILFTLLTIILSPMFLYSSTQIRVDFLAYLFASCSVLLIKEKRYFWSGICLGIGFCICQKTIWFLSAMQLALGLQWVLQYRNKIYFKNILHFNIGFLLVLSAYIGFWSYQSHIDVVLKSLFIEPYILNGVSFYQKNTALKQFIFVNNHIWIILLCIALVYEIFFAKPKAIFEITYTASLFLILLMCKQPFFYLFLALVPGLLALFPKTLTNLENQDPLTLSWLNFSPFLILFIINLSYIYPQISATSYQDYNIQMAQDLLGPHDTYMAGNFILIDKKQSISGLKHLDGPEVDYINHPDKQLLPIMRLSSLYYAPTSIQKIINDVQISPPKIYIDNKNFHDLSPKFQRFLQTQYQHFWGSIFVYAPAVAAGQQVVHIHHAGVYKIQSEHAISLHGYTYAPNMTIHLKKQPYTSQAKSNYRLVLIPQHLKIPLKPEFKKNTYKEMSA